MLRSEVESLLAYADVDLSSRVQPSKMAKLLDGDIGETAAFDGAQLTGAAEAETRLLWRPPSAAIEFWGS
jgi:hypothetical protein